MGRRRSEGKGAEDRTSVPKCRPPLELCRRGGTDAARAVNNLPLIYTMHWSFYFAPVAVGVVISMHALAQVLSSPLLLLCILPLFFVGTILSILVAPIALGVIFDRRHKRDGGESHLKRAARPMAFSTPAAWQAVLTRSQWSVRAPQSLAPLHPDSLMVSAALNDILIMIVRDFVLTWYTSLSSSPSFPTSVSSTLHKSVANLIDRMASIDYASLVVKRILPKLTAHIDNFRLSEVALRGAALERRLTQSEELDLLLASRYAGKGGGRLHPAISNLSSSFTKQSEEAHLKSLVNRALPYILPEVEAKSQGVRIVVREIVACTVLYPVMDMLSDPDFWNRLIDNMVSSSAVKLRFII
jgi:sorting nexin-25